MDIPVVWPDYFEDCIQCVERLKEMLQEMEGMRSVTINTDRRTIQVTYAKDLLTFEAIREAARQLGVTVAERFKHDRIRILGLDCPDCASKVESAIMRLRGVVWASLNYATSVLIVEYEPLLIDLSAIRRRIRDFGYDIEEEVAKTPSRAKKFRFQRSARLVLTVLSGVLLVAGGIVYFFKGVEPVSNSLFLAAAVTGGAFSARSGVLSLRSFAPDTNFLMTAAAIGAIAIREYSEAAAVMFLFSLGSTLEAYTVDRTRRSIRSLIEAFPSYATVKRDGQIMDVPLEQIDVGETVIIRPGDKVPVDGIVIAGESTVNEAPITGESVPKEKHKGDPIYAGSINGRGSLEVRATTTVENNTIARIVHIVEGAQAQKAPTQRFSETFGRIYTPIVIGLAVLVAVLGPTLFGGTHREWLVSALTLLVVSCPCALVISTPVAIVAAIGNAAKLGVLIKGGAFLEALGGISAVAFDKTGTLTSGKMRVCDVVPFDGRSVEEVLAVAAAVESRSEHPLADAIIEKAREAGVEEMRVSFFEAFPGKGARAVANGEVFYIGSRRLMEEFGINVPDSTAVAGMKERGCSIIYVADETKALGVVGVADTIRDGTREAIEMLKQVGIKRTVMLTGDTVHNAKAVAEALGIDDVYAELLPEDKVSRVRELALRRGGVVMVGDGINDAPALAAANVGVAMGGVGSPAAVEAADVALMADDIRMLPYAIDLSRKACNIIRQNILFALAVVVLLVVGALAKWVTLAVGVLGHEGSALLVIANSMRLLGRRQT